MMMTDALTEQLGSLTAWDADAGDRGVWKRALAAEAGGPEQQTASKSDSPSAARPGTPWQGSAGGARSGRRKWSPFATGAVSVLCVLMLVGILLPSLGKARRSARRVPTASAALESLESDSQNDYSGNFELRGLPDYSNAPAFDLNAVLPSGQPGASPFRVVGRSISRNDVSSPTVRGSTARHVVRRATMHLETDDVRAAFALAQSLVSPALGEYVQAADIRERSNGYEADMVLRVEASRLDEVLIALRELGTVLTDRIDTDDVTDRVVDLEARLRNERNVDAELLQLLADRDNDELADVLAVRRELARVRQEIEVMLAQRNEIARLVSLSTITLVLREPESEPEPEPEAMSAWDEFTASLSEAWSDGVDTLGRTVTGFVRIVVGGLPWWIVIGAVSVVVWRKYRAEHPRALPE